MTFDSIEIDSPAYTISGNAISLTASTGIFTTYTSGVSTFNIDATLSGTDITVAAGGELDLNGAISDTNGLVLDGGGILGGTGRFARIGGANRPALPGIQGVGNLTVSGNVTLDRGTTFSASLNGPGQNNSLVALGGTNPTPSASTRPLWWSRWPRDSPRHQGLASRSSRGTSPGPSRPFRRGERPRHDLQHQLQAGCGLDRREGAIDDTDERLERIGAKCFRPECHFHRHRERRGGTPTGSVTFEDGGSVLGTTALNASGVATFTTSDLAVGDNSITAVYAGNAAFSRSTSPVFDQTVNPAARPRRVSSTANPSVLRPARDLDRRCRGRRSQLGDADRRHGDFPGRDNR